MGIKRLGTKIELDMVKSLFKAGSFGFRAPGSGTYIVEDDIVPYSSLQERCKFIISTKHIDLGYDPHGYITSDYAGYFPSRALSSRVKITGDCEDNEFRFVEVKTVRLRKSHLTSREKHVDRTDIDRKTHLMTERFNLLVKDDRKVTKQPDPGNPGKRRSAPNPYHGMYRKSDFCMELQRTWYMAEIARTTGIFACKVAGYLQVRFVGSNVELWVKIATLASWQDSTMTLPRDPSCTKLAIDKSQANEITWRWYQ